MGEKSLYLKCGSLFTKAAPAVYPLKRLLNCEKVMPMGGSSQDLWESRLGLGAYATSQRIRTSKLLFPGEQLTEEAERLAARREIDRLSALKFLQALSAQLVKLTGLSFESFQVQEDLRAFFRPLQPGDTRTIDVASRMFVLDGMEVGFDQLANLPVLHVLMDQSKIGCAAAAWVASQTLCPGPLDF